MHCDISSLTYRQSVNMPWKRFVEHRHKIVVEHKKRTNLPLLSHETRLVPNGEG